jgi:hypothetical protein
MNIRSQIMRAIHGAHAVIAIVGALSLSLLAHGAQTPAPNVIFFATDDLCDWVGPLDSPIRAKTPNMDRLAARGVTFMNAQCSGTFCAPARTAVFTGRHPSTTGAYTTQVYFRDHPELRPLQVALQQAGYETYGAGKLYHHPAGYVDLRGWTEFHVRTQGQKETGWPVDVWRRGAPLPAALPSSPYARERGIVAPNPGFMEYAALPNEAEKSMTDTLHTDWAISVLQQKHDRPFFIGLGLYSPHQPNYAPQKYYDMYPLDEIKLPAIKENDTDDLPPAVKKFMDHRKATIQDKIVEMGLFKEVIRAYLACTSYADAQLGRVLDALDASPNQNNTVVIFWSDQGFHHGEKGHWGKETLWQRTEHIPFIWAGPGIARNAKVAATVSAIDLYPTLVDLCHLSPDSGLEGTSLAANLQNPVSAKDRNVVTCQVIRGGYSVTNQQWRYIHYADNTEELYDEGKDYNEWTNLAREPQYRAVMDELSKSAPKNFAPAGPEARQLQLVTDGEKFHWELKKDPPKNKNRTEEADR